MPSPVVLDRVLVSRMRAHQIEGIRFMYNCVMEHTNPGFQGCILADSMGLGKSLQVPS